MPVEARTLRAIMRLEADKAAISATVDDVERVEASVEDLDARIQKLNVGQRVQGGVGSALGRLPGFDPLGKLTDKTTERLEFLGDGFDQLITTFDDLGIELDGLSARGLQAATSLSRISTDPIGASVQAVGQAIGAWQDFTKGIEEGQEKVSSAWDKRLSQSFDTAVDVADDYVAAQQRIIDILRKFPIIGKLFVDAEEAVNASAVKVQRTLVRSAVDYDDYVAAVQKMNANLGDWARAIELLDQAQFEHQRELLRHKEVIAEVMDAYERGTATLEQVRDQMLQLGTVEGGLRALGAQIQIIDQHAANFKELGAAYRQWQEGLAQAEQEWLDERARAQEEFNEEVTRLEEELGEERQAAIDRYGELIATEEESLQADLAAIEERGADTRRTLMENFIQQSDAAEEAYYARRAQLAENYGIEAARAEEDHQRRIQRMREDAAIREQGLIEARDALGLVRARRDAERERRRADEDFGVQQARRSEDYARQLAQMEQEFARQQAQRQAEYERQLAELDATLTEETQTRQRAYDEQQMALEEAKREEQQTASDHYSEALNKLNEKFDKEKTRINQGYNDEQTRLNDAWDQRRRDLGFYLSGEAQMLANYYATTEQMLADWISRVQASFRTGLPTPTFPGRQSGGYVGAGLYQVGEAGEEFVLSNPTTQTAERLAGRPLTQAGIVTAMGGNKQVNFTANIYDARDPDQVARAVEQKILMVMNQVFEKVH